MASPTLRSRVFSSSTGFSIAAPAALLRRDGFTRAGARPAVQRSSARAGAGLAAARAGCASTAGRCLRFRPGRAGIFPRHPDRGAKHGCGGGGERDTRAALAAPGAIDGREDGGLGVHEIVLLLRVQLDHSPGRVRIPERREDAAADTEIGVVHVDALLRAFESQGEAAKIIGHHGAVILIQRGFGSFTPLSYPSDCLILMKPYAHFAPSIGLMDLEVERR